MIEKKNIRVGIGFVTGRKSFRRILRTYIHNWLECGLTERQNVKLDLYVAYDLKYSNTKASDYTDVSKSLLDLVDDCYFIGAPFIDRETKDLVDKSAITSREAELIFGSGYAAKRNAVLYTAIKNGADYLIFLDDDEYPLAVTKTRDTAIWSGSMCSIRTLYIFRIPILQTASLRICIAYTVYTV